MGPLVYASMTRTFAASPAATSARELVEALQARFVDRLQTIPGADRFSAVEWLRDDGRHGGGSRFEAPTGGPFDRGSVNVSQVHYDDLPDRKLASATALSTIIHPTNPRAPSVHVHISWTAMRSGSAYWRVMADLNPSVQLDEDKARFDTLVAEVAGDHAKSGIEQGERYFWIPALERHRGVSHFYLEGHDSGDFEADRGYAQRFGEAVLDGYVEILRHAVERTPTDDDAAVQRAYHTLYLFQVLTLDRGTTSGLLVHDQNDVGILGSLPSTVDATLLRGWAESVPALQRPLVHALADALGGAADADVTEDRKRELAAVVRAHYKANPEALKLQASGAVIPTTVDNHGSAR